MTLIEYVSVVHKDNIDIKNLTEKQIIDKYCPSQLLTSRGCLECLCKLGVITCSDCWNQKYKGVNLI